MMQAMKLSELAAVTAGQLTGDAQFNAISSDTRTLQPGDLFVALSGENFDGNTYVDSAADKGAVAAVVSKPTSRLANVLVADTRLALAQIAAHNRAAFDKPLIALTGSAGKTSTKEMLASILACRGKVLATAGNLNNEIGVPKTLLSLAPQHDYAVIEMGAAKAGDIEYLCQFVKPDVAIVTNAAPAHLAGFGDVDTVARTKGAIFSGLNEQGIAVINSDDQYASLWQQMAGSAQVVRFSLHSQSADVFATDIHIDEHGVQQFQLHSQGKTCAVKLPLLGRHNVANALAATAAAIAVGATLDNVRSGLAGLKPVAGRLCPHRTQAGGLLIDDTYNANPVAVKAAIDVIAAMNKPAYLLLGNMGELGAEAEAFHAEVGRYAAAAGLAGVLAVGPNAKAVCDGFGSEQARYFDNIETMIAYSREHLLDQVMLVKGSRSAAMERVVSALLEQAGGIINNGGQK